jgi:NAD(P)-dependent dehydrogenase (short-subunit alcohol dehydrogenase family)
LRKADHPKIVNMSSGMGEQAGVMQGGYPAYRQSKWALNGLAMQLHADLEDKFFVDSMCPGWCHTDMGGSGAPRSAEQGADTAVWLASTSGLPSGKFWRDRKEIDW